MLSSVLPLPASPLDRHLWTQTYRQQRQLRYFVDTTAYCEFLFFSFSSRKLHTNYQMSDQINSLIHLMLSVYKSYHQTLKYGHQRKNTLQNLTGLIEI